MRNEKIGVYCGYRNRALHDAEYARKEGRADDAAHFEDLAEKLDAEIRAMIARDKQIRDSY